MSDQECPLNRNYICNERCKWYDFEHNDCRMIGGFWKIREGINEVTDMLIDIEKTIDRGLDALWKKTTGI